MKLLRWISRPCWALRLSLGRSLLRPIVKQHRDIFNDNPAQVQLDNIEASGGCKKLKTGLVEDTLHMSQKASSESLM
jgi:hypothetical protein